MRTDRREQIAAGTDVDLARVPLGVAVRAATPKPDVSSVAAFKEALLKATIVAVPASTSGIWLTTDLFPRIGVGDKINVKAMPRGTDVTRSLGGKRRSWRPAGQRNRARSRRRFRGRDRTGDSIRADVFGRRRGELERGSRRSTADQIFGFAPRLRGHSKKRNGAARDVRLGALVLLGLAFELGDARFGQFEHTIAGFHAYNSVLSQRVVEAIRVAVLYP